MFPCRSTTSTHYILSFDPVDVDSFILTVENAGKLYSDSNYG